MPRFIKHRDRSTEELTKRAQSFTVRGYKKTIDPFPLGFGTIPEKIVYRELSRRNIPFYYLNDFRVSIPELEFNEYFQADFVIPSLMLIIEVQGAYWHSKEKTIESDALKFTYYELMGYRVLAWWDYEIISNINLLFAADSQLTAASVFDNTTDSAEMAPMRRTKTDTSKGIRTLNYKRAQRSAYKKKSISVKMRRKSYSKFRSNA